MPKKSPAKPKLQGSATAIIKKYLDTNNRPWSVSNIVDGTAAYGVTTTVAKRALEELATNQLVDYKVYGKQTFYLSKQSQYETPSPDEVKSQDSEIARKREELQGLQRQRQTLQRQASAAESELSDEDLKSRTTELRTQVDTLEKKLLAQKTSNSTLTKDDTEKLEDTVRRRCSEWKKRKKAVKELVDMICEKSGKRAKHVFDDAGMDADPLVDDPTLNGAKPKEPEFANSLLNQVEGALRPKEKLKIRR